MTMKICTFINMHVPSKYKMRTFSMKMKIFTFSMCRLKEVMDLRIRRSTINLSIKLSKGIFKENKIFRIKDKIKYTGRNFLPENDIVYKASKPYILLTKQASQSPRSQAGRLKAPWVPPCWK